MATAWTTTADVATVTGATVTDTQLSRAQASIEMFSNRIYTDTPRIRPRDLHWLGLAVAYQAAWEAGQYDLNTRMDSTQVQQDGIVANFEDRAMSLSPRAKWALQRCSWMRSRTVHLRTPFENRGRYSDPLAESADDQQRWTPMGGRP
ncbi:hypothetical protein ACFWPV_09835 [Streptomyces uncialis]|uniref:hypothetical protein n=1 Tax=Streptomyces uncialis TaxID=1048205 RepID=UPI003656CD6D